MKSMNFVIENEVMIDEYHHAMMLAKMLTYVYTQSVAKLEYKF
jgi:hypothetical protein